MQGFIEIFLNRHVIVNIGVHLKRSRLRRSFESKFNNHHKHS
eukprot:09943.XXX_49014_49139_1 [CDS] Oithona nana genome sequencing.